MSYYVNFKVKIEGLENEYACIDDCNPAVSWRLEEMIKQSTGLKWQIGNNGLCKDIIPHITNGLIELMNYPEKYKQYEPKNGYETIEDCKIFFMFILIYWFKFCKDDWTKILADVTYFWIE